MEKIKKNFFDRPNLIIMLFIVFISLRLFVSSSTVFLESDHSRFLAVASSFPHHTLSNEQLYIGHPPFYPYVIYFFTLIVSQDYIAGIVISLLASALTFFILYRLFMILTNNFFITYLVLVFFTLSVELIITSNSVLRWSFQMLLISSTIYFYLKGVKYNDKKTLVISAIIGALAGITSDHSLFLLPTFILICLIFRSGIPKIERLSWKYVAIPFVIVALFFGMWTFTKAYTYSINDYYPAGLDGAPVYTRDFRLIHVLNQHYFEDYEPYQFAGDRQRKGFTFRARDYIYRLGYMFNLVPFTIPRGINFTTMEYLLFPKHITYMILLYLPLTLFALLGFVFAIINHNKTNLFLLGLFLIFIFPVTQVVSTPTYILFANVIFFYFISYGIFNLFRKYRKYIIIILAIGLLILIPFWVYSHPNLVLLNKGMVASQNTGDYINNNIPKDKAIMVQSGYNLRLNYLTENRMLGLPPKSKDLMKLIDFYDVDYVIYGRYYTWDRAFYSLDTVDYIRSNQDKFKLIATIQEDYGNIKKPISTDEMYIYEVTR